MRRQGAFKHPAVRVVAKVVLLGAIVGATAAAIIPAEPLPLNIRWASDLSDGQRTELERQLSLSSGEARDGTTRSYVLTDPSRANIERIVRHSAVADTSNIDRETFRPLAESNRPREIRTWIIGLALAGTALWELLAIAGRQVHLRSGLVFALIGGAPVLLIAAAAGVVGAAVFGIHPLWRESDTPNLPHAAYEQDLALLERTLEAGGDPDARDTVLIDGETVTVTPLEAAVAGGNLFTVQWLIAKGASVDPLRLKRLQCLAAEIDEAEIESYLETITSSEDNGACDGVELPIRR